MFNKIEAGGHTAYNLMVYVIDSEQDLNYLPMNIPMGSQALCLSNGEVYILNGSGEWVAI